MLEKDTEERRTNKKEKLQNRQKCPEKIVFWGVGGERRNLSEIDLLEKLQNTICFRKVEKRTFSLTLSVLGKCHFGGFNLELQTTTKSGFQRAQGKTKNSLFWGQWVFFGKGPLKGFLLSLIHNSCALLKTLFHFVFSKHSFCREHSVSCKKLPKIVVVFRHVKRFFFYFPSFVFCLVLVRLEDPHHTLQSLSPNR